MIKMLKKKELEIKLMIHLVITRAKYDVIEDE